MSPNQALGYVNWNQATSAVLGPRGHEGKKELYTYTKKKKKKLTPRKGKEFVLRCFRSCYAGVVPVSYRFACPVDISFGRAAGCPVVFFESILLSQTDRPNVMKLSDFELSANFAKQKTTEMISMSCLNNTSTKKPKDNSWTPSPFSLISLFFVFFLQRGPTAATSRCFRAKIHWEEQLSWRPKPKAASNPAVGFKSKKNTKKQKPSGSDSSQSTALYKALKKKSEVQSRPLNLWCRNPQKPPEMCRTEQKQTEQTEHLNLLCLLACCLGLTQPFSWAWGSKGYTKGNAVEWSDQDNQPKKKQPPPSHGCCLLLLAETLLRLHLKKEQDTEKKHQKEGSTNVLKNPMNK